MYDRRIPDPKILWSPRVGFNWDVTGDQRRRFAAAPASSPAGRRTSGSRTRSATPACSPVEPSRRTTRRAAVQSESDRYKPTTATGAPAATYELALTDPTSSSRRSGAATSPSIDACPGARRHRRVIYNNGRQRHLLHQRQPAAARPPSPASTARTRRGRWHEQPHQLATSPTPMVLKNQNVGDSWNLGVLRRTRPERAAFVKARQLRRVEEHGRSRLDRLRSWNGNPHPAIRTTRGSATRQVARATLLPAAPTRRASAGRHDVLGVLGGAHQRQHQLRVRGDMNGDGGTSNDLIYIPRDTSGDELPDVRRRRAAPSPPPSRPPRSRRSSSRTTT